MFFDQRMCLIVIEIDEYGAYSGLEDNAWRIAILLARTERRILKDIHIAEVARSGDRSEILGSERSKP